MLASTKLIEQGAHLSLSSFSSDPRVPAGQDRRHGFVEERGNLVVGKTLECLSVSPLKYFVKYKCKP